MFVFQGFVQSAQSSELETCVKLDFNTDFTFFLENNEFHDPVHVVTESEIIKCSAVLLAQHSNVLRESIKEDKELFLTDNKHVRECLSVLYGGSVKLTKENFQDILKFMVAFNIPVARKQVLDWMSQNRWNLDNASLLLNGSMVATKAFSGKTTTMASLREEVYKPCRQFLREHLVKMIRPDSTDVRYQNLDSAMECVISGVVDKKELLALLLHQDLIPDYVPWVKMLMDQSSYNLFLNSLDRPDISNKMSLCSRTQFEELFDKIEDFENITLKEYKQLNRYKMKVHEKMTIVQSLRFMKENGSLYSCWKILDADGMSVLSTAFTDISDQFCIIECLLSWVSANRSSAIDMDVVVKIIFKAIQSLSGNIKSNSLQYYTDIIKGILENISTSCINWINVMASVNSTSHISNHYDISINSLIPSKFEDQIVYGGGYGGQIVRRDQIILTCNVRISRNGEQNNLSQVSTLTVTLFQDRVPEVSCKDQRFNSTHHILYVYGCRTDNVNRREGGYNVCRGAVQPVNTPTHIPLYTDPSEAFKTVKQFPKSGYRGDLLQDNYQRVSSLAHHGQADNESYIKFAVLCVSIGGVK